MTPQLVWRHRRRLKDAVRRYFDDRGYLEIDTPILVKCPGTEVHLDYFETSWLDHSGRPHQFFLRSSPELHMKRLMAELREPIYQIAPCFRNGGEFSKWHHPEFLMIEWYRPGVGMSEGMIETENLLRYCAESFTGSMEKWPTRFLSLSIEEAFRRFADLSIEDMDPGFAMKARNSGCFSVNENDDFETAFFKVLIDRVEPELKDLGACWLYNYPPSQAALSCVHEGWAERFELYLSGIELANGFHELTDYDENRLRLEESNYQRQKIGKKRVPTDMQFLKAIEKGLPSSYGVAVGFDRLLAVLLGSASLDRLTPFRSDFVNG